MAYFLLTSYISGGRIIVLRGGGRLSCQLTSRSKMKMPSNQFQWTITALVATVGVSFVLLVVRLTQEGSASTDMSLSTEGSE